MTTEAAYMYAYLLLMDDNGESPNEEMRRFIDEASELDFVTLTFGLAGTVRDLLDAGGAPVDSLERSLIVEQRRAILAGETE